MEREITINYKGVELDIKYWFQPEEKPELGIEAQYPGCPASIDEIIEIKHNGISFLELLEDQEEEIKNKIWNVIK